MGQFGDGTVRRWDSSAMGQFGDGTVWQLISLAMGHFAIGHLGDNAVLKLLW